MTQLAYLATPEMRAATGFHRNDAERQQSEKLKDLIPFQFLAQHRRARGVGPKRLGHNLRMVEPDLNNLRYDLSPLWIVADPPSHIDAVGGRSQHQCRIHGINKAHCRYATLR